MRVDGVELPEREWTIGDEDPLNIWWLRNGTLVDFSSGYTFAAKLVAMSARTTAIFTKSTGFTGAAGSGVETNGTPNLVVAWATSGELNSVPSSGPYLLQIVATKTADGSESTFKLVMQMDARVG